MAIGYWLTIFIISCIQIITCMDSTPAERDYIDCVTLDDYPIKINKKLTDQSKIVKLSCDDLVIDEETAQISLPITLDEYKKISSCWEEPEKIADICSLPTLQELLTLADKLELVDLKEKLSCYLSERLRKQKKINRI